VSDTTRSGGRHPIIAANWKMHHDHLVSIQVIQKLSYRLDAADYQHCDVVVCPPFTDLRTLQTLTEADRIPIQLGAQTCHWADEGAYTGAVSPPMLARLNVRYVMVGHSERRQLFGELDAAVNLKARAALAAGLSPIICIGETLAERDAGETLGRVQTQLDAALADVTDADLERIVIAYEPVWAIGTGRNATPAQAEEVHRFIRARVAARAPAIASRLRILYGGSVKPDNIAALMAEDDVDGGLVGGASLSAESFIRIVQAGKKTGATGA